MWWVVQACFNPYTACVFILLKDKLRSEQNTCTDIRNMFTILYVYSHTFKHLLMWPPHIAEYVVFLLRPVKCISPELFFWPVVRFSFHLRISITAKDVWITQNKKKCKLQRAEKCQACHWGWCCWVDLPCLQIGLQVTFLSFGGC